MSALYDTNDEEVVIQVPVYSGGTRDFRLLGTTWPAKRSHVDAILSAPTDTEEGRSEFQWVRLVNGDLILGVFPQGAMYEVATQRWNVDKNDTTEVNIVNQFTGKVEPRA